MREMKKTKKLMEERGEKLQFFFNTKFLDFANRLI